MRDMMSIGNIEEVDKRATLKRKIIVRENKSWKRKIYCTTGKYSEKETLQSKNLDSKYTVHV